VPSPLAIDSPEGQPMTIMTGRATDWRASGACRDADPDLFSRSRQLDGHSARWPRRRRSAPAAPSVGHAWNSPPPTRRSRVSGAGRHRRNDTRPVAATNRPRCPSGWGISRAGKGRRPALTDPRSGRSSSGRDQDRAAQEVTDVARWTGSTRWSARTSSTIQAACGHRRFQILTATAPAMSTPTAMISGLRYVLTPSIPWVIACFSGPDA
jgi:hypothetical protein